ncbi:MAG: metalloprotease TldD [Gammaproteobacteria bacterium]|nr:metalloprotease TldD [Gammaproteobacteria bacterium]
MVGKNKFDESLLAPTDLDVNDLDKILSGLISPAGIDYADLYFQSSRFESWGLEDGIVKQGSFGIESGVGVRAVSQEKTGFAYSDDISLLALKNASKTVKAISRQSQSFSQSQSQKSSALALSPSLNSQQLYSPLDSLGSLSSEEKVRLLQSVDQYARDADPRVSQVIVSLAGVHNSILIAASDGTLASDIRPLVRLSVSVIVEQNGKREQGGSGGGARVGYGYFLEDERAKAFAIEAVRQAVLKLDAVDAPAGKMPVVLGPGWPGVLLHEAVGHGLEGDFNRKGSSAFSGRIGEKIASTVCTIVDDGTLHQRRGSLNVDDEGTPTQCTTLIENGVLTGYIHDKLNAKLMSTQSTGNGRRQSYAHLPMPRMTNTYMLAGDSDPNEIIASVKKGLYAVNFAGGQVDITSGKFVFSASEAYLIEDGIITNPVRGATLIGSGSDVLTKVSMVGNDLKLDEGVGTCGKEGQSVPVGVGQPTLKVDELTVGGTNVK